MNRQNIKTNIKTFIVSTIISFVILELTLFILNQTGYLKLQTVPNYTLKEVNKGMWVADINPDFGVWHPAYATYRHQTRCFDVLYQANSYGARDIERSRSVSEKRVIMLGDSFVEGYGIADEERMSNRLEKSTGIPHLNFGTSGNFGSTQYYLLYKTLAQQFSHNVVIVAILPANDFMEDNPTVGSSFNKRYRPYWQGEYPNYKLVYHIDTLEDSFFRPHSTVTETKTDVWFESIKTFLRHFSYTYNTFLQIFHVTQDVAETSVDYTIYSGYYDYEETELNRLKYSLEHLTALANNKTIVILTLPIKQDFARYQPDEKPPLSKALEQFSQKHHIYYIDLLPFMYDNTDDWHNYFLRCDSHWNGYGNEIAAHYLEQQLNSIDNTILH